MEYLRVFARRSFAEKWFGKEPKLSQLLECFDLKRNLAPNQPLSPVSVFRARNHREELQTVAALFQITPKGTEKRYAVCITKDDCDEAGVGVDPTRGQTGVSFVDFRHSDLTGKLENFIELTKVLTRRIWEGENRIHTYSAHAILGEIAVFSRLPDAIDDAAQDRCRQVLDKSPESFCFPPDRDVVEISGKMDDRERIVVTAVRELRVAADADRLLGRLRQWLIQRLSDH